MPFIIIIIVVWSLWDEFTRKSIIGRITKGILDSNLERKRDIHKDKVKDKIKEEEQFSDDWG